ncbi:MAG: hypothetical protein AB7E32_02310 [Desulfovibrio sp.]
MSEIWTEQTEILECTLRDGSYAVNFQFTSKDTAVIAKCLERSGIGYIEIGHGLGLNASNMGKGAAAENDEAYMCAVSGSLRQARWGMFCIPGIARLDDLRLARSQGMHFVRIGVQPDNFAAAESFVLLARSLGMLVFVNLMKSYTVDAPGFGALARQAEGYGADALYLVDSAGCMLPAQVREYLAEARSASSLDLGFHGHDNLRLSVANALSASEHGARWIDTTLQGIGRSSGNPSTEAFAALLLRKGQFQEADLLSLLRIGAHHIRPLLRAAGHDEMEIISGLSGFHSGFMAQVAGIAAEENAPLAEVVLRLCERTQSDAPDAVVREIACSLRLERESTPPPTPDNTPAALTAVSAVSSVSGATGVHEELRDILRRIAVQARKRGTHALLNVVVAPELNPELAGGRRVSHVVHVFPDAVFGSAEVGNAGAAMDLLRESKGQVDFHLLDVAPLPGSDLLLPELAHQLLSPYEILEYNDADVLLRSVAAQLQGILCGLNRKRVVLFGTQPLDGSPCRMEALLRMHHAHVERTEALFPGAPAANDLKTFAEQAAQCDVLVVLAQGFAAYAEQFIATAHKPVVFEARIGSLGPENIRLLREQGVAVYRPDMRSVMAAELRTLLSYRLNHHQGFPQREINGIRMVSHGLIGQPGDMVVDDVLRPSNVIGISDGAGRTFPPGSQEEQVRRLEDLLHEGRHNAS